MFTPKMAVQVGKKCWENDDKPWDEIDVQLFETIWEDDPWAIAITICQGCLIRTMWHLPSIEIQPLNLEINVPDGSDVDNPSRYLGGSCKLFSWTMLNPHLHRQFEKGWLSLKLSEFSFAKCWGWVLLNFERQIGWMSLKCWSISTSPNNRFICTVPILSPCFVSDRLRVSGSLALFGRPRGHPIHQFRGTVRRWAPAPGYTKQGQKCQNLREWQAETCQKAGNLHGLQLISLDFNGCPPFFHMSSYFCSSAGYSPMAKFKLEIMHGFQEARDVERQLQAEMNHAAKRCSRFGQSSLLKS